MSGCNEQHPRAKALGFSIRRREAKAPRFHL